MPMPHTDMTEKGLETIMVEYLRDHNGYEQGQSSDFDREYTLDPGRVERFIRATQPEKVEQTMCFAVDSQKKNFFRRLSEKIAQDGITNVLRKGFRFNGLLFDLYYPIPSEMNPSALDFYRKNIFSVTRQLHHSAQQTLDALDVCIFLNGFPIITVELKNRYTGQTYKNAIKQYQEDRPASDPLFAPRRCAVHFAVDDDEIWMCSELKGKDSWFLPFNKGVNGGAGNPWKESKILTEYLWQEILQKDSLADILENYAQVIEKEEEGKPKPVKKVIWPRYHQLDCVRKLLFETRANPIGQRFLIQHSAGSGKSNTITWLAYQLVTLVEDDENIVDSVIVVTDRVNLDKQIRNNITAFKRLSNIVAWAEDSATLREALQGGKKIIITTIHKFQFILDAIGGSLADLNFAIIIDEAHSSQSGSMSADMNLVVSGNAEGDEEDIEDRILKIIKGRKMAPNVNYYAFTATPKNKTLEMFGKPVQRPDGKIGHEPFHEYTMKQAIEEGFIMDVLRNYTPYKSYYKILKAIDSDPEFDKKQASQKIRAFVERQPQTIQEKSLIIVNHFLDKVIGGHKVGGQARAMVVTSSIIRAIEFYYAISKQLEEMHSPYKAVVAFSGEKEYGGKMVTEATINGFPSSEIEKKIETDPYRILVVANKFQTGYDQPLLHTMYVDKQLSDVKAVQTLSRLNRTHPDKEDTLIIDFINTKDDIQKAFQPFYQETYLSQEINTDLIYKTQKMLRSFKVYDEDDIKNVTSIYFDEDKRKANKTQAAITNALLPVQHRYNDLNQEQRYQFRKTCRTFVKWYGYISQITRMFDRELHDEYIFNSYLAKIIPPDPATPFDLGNKVKLEYYNLEKTFEGSIAMEKNTAGVYDPAKVKRPVKMEETLSPLEQVIQKINEQYMGEFTDGDKVMITALHEKLRNNKKLVKSAQSDGQQIFEKNIFPQLFDEAAQEAYMESTETYTRLFEDAAKYKAIMSALAHAMFDELKAANA